MNAGELLEKIFREGLYQDLSSTKNEYDKAETYFTRQLPNDREKMKWDDAGLIVIWSPKHVYHITNEQQYKKFLHDVGVLPFVAKFDEKKIVNEHGIDVWQKISKFQLEKSTPYVNITARKAGKNPTGRIPVLGYSEDLDELAFYVANYKRKKNELDEQYRTIKELMFKCPDLMGGKKFESEYASVVLSHRTTKYINTQELYRAYGRDFFIEYAEVLHTSLDDLFVKGGVIEKDAINKWRIVINATLNTSIMLLESKESQVRSLKLQSQILTRNID